ncbi:SH3 domain-binding glutamic acid-rich-like protein 3 isoform X2 [Pseudophryne corroboree]|uniref:SH3 domain-binding glutamic acid-rich-like protein 3 isoform X2 n=1 Tax=Pseudophryne corroboree TaxID=495146 RepID=UPI00308162B9
MALTLYMTLVTSSREIQSHQNEIIRILDTNKIQYERVDISVDKGLLEDMRKKAGNPTALPPLLFRGDKYIGVQHQVSQCFSERYVNMRHLHL